jgi:hypothetical protein
MFHFLIMLLLALLPDAKTSIIKTVDASGAPFPKVLVIVKSLEGEGEVARYLTDQDGRTPKIQLSSGLYRVIATCPYGICQTTVREFLGSDVPSELTLEIPVNSTDLNGETVGAPRIQLVLETANGKASGAHILIRDPEAKWEKWYVADATGSAEVELVSDPSVVVVIFGGKVSSQVVSFAHMNQEENKKPQGIRSGVSLKTVTVRLGERK